MDRIARFFSGRAGPLRLALLALSWSLPALTSGLQTDDHLLRWAVTSGSDAWDLFHSDADFLSSRRASGFLPWWASPQLSVHFFRPLSSLSHTLEFTIYPSQPWLMLLVNVALYVAIVWVASALYRRFLPSEGAAAMAGLMFAIDEAHAESVGWVAGRNTLLAMLFSLLALYFQQRGPARRNVLASSLCVGCALFSAEAGVWALLFVLVATLAERPRSPREWLRTLAPQLCVGLLWLLLYVRGGYGVRGSAWYRDPTQPWRALPEAVADVPLWMVGLFGPTGVNFSILHHPTTARLVALPAAALLLVLLWPALRARESRFWLAITLLGLAPVIFTVPSSRVLFGASFGASAVLALIVVRASVSVRARCTRWLFLSFHVWMAFLLFPLGLRAVRGLEQSTQNLATALPATSDVVLVRSPLELLPSYALCLDASCGDERMSKRSVHQLYSGGSELWVERSAENALDLTATRGWGETPMQGLYCAQDQLPARDSERTLPALRARVIASTTDGRPARVRFTFPSPLEDPRRTFMTWVGTRPVPWRPPALGQRVRLEPINLLGAFGP